jgi:hypothetical protein
MHSIDRVNELLEDFCTTTAVRRALPEQEHRLTSAGRPQSVTLSRHPDDGRWLPAAA